MRPGSRRFPGEGNGNPFQYACLGKPMDRGAWWAIVHRVTRVRHNLVTKPLLQKKTEVKIAHIFTIKMYVSPMELNTCVGTLTYTHTANILGNLEGN